MTFISNPSSVNTLLSTRATSTAGKEASSGVAFSDSFATVLSSHSKGISITIDEVKNFFAQNPSELEIADKAAALGLNRVQIISALQTAGYGGESAANLERLVDRFVASSDSGVFWGADGRLVSTKTSAAEVAAVADLSHLTVEQMSAQAHVWSAQGADMAEIARRAESAGVSQETMNTLSALNRGAGRLAIDNAYSNYSLKQSFVGGVVQDSSRFVRLGAPKLGSLTDAQQLWNAQHSGMYTDTAATGGNFNWTDLGGWQRPKSA